MTTREQWSYTNSTGVEKTEDISIENEGAQAKGASAVKKINPDYNQASTNPLTDGWTNEKPGGAGHSYQFSRADTALLELEKRGIMHWSDLTDYEVPAMVWGSDGKQYRALLASGPSSTAKDPSDLANADYWQRIDLVYVPRLDFKYEVSAGTPGPDFGTANTTYQWPLNIDGTNRLPGSSISSNDITLPHGYIYDIFFQAYAGDNIPAATTPLRSWLAKTVSEDSPLIIDVCNISPDSRYVFVHGLLDATGESSPQVYGFFIRSSISGLQGGFAANILSFPEKYVQGWIKQTAYRI